MFKLKNIVDQNKNALPIYLRSLLKEYLQLNVLYFIYTNDLYNNALVFTGGTCLRHFYQLPRLSEDLDFDVVKAIDSSQLLSYVVDSFNKHFMYSDLTVSLKQKGRQILFKFPVLYDLGLASASESNYLYIKLDLEFKPITKYAQTKVSLKSYQNLAFVAKHYDLPTLFAKKTGALLLRNVLKGKENRVSFKGRDYFDLIWLLQNQTPINLAHLRIILQDPQLTIAKLKQMLTNKINQTTQYTYFSSDLIADLLPFISDSSMVKTFAQSFKQLFEQNINNLTESQPIT